MKPLDLSGGLSAGDGHREIWAVGSGKGGTGKSFLTASLGIALGAAEYERPEEMLRDADTAMYSAKAGGRSDRVVFHKDMHAKAMEQLQLETDLRHVVDRGELRLFYQPIVHLRSGKLRGFEALVRWQHPERGLLSPGEFLGVAHATGLMAPIGWWVLAEACRQMQSWRQRQPELAEATISVNLDGKQLSTYELVEQVERVLDETGLESGALQLEITESMIIENPRVATAILDRLKQREIGVHIDDFGTGYSSLSQLPRFPIDALKIDRSFVAGMSVDDDNLEIVRTIVALARNLGLGVMAEGVETEEQLAQLRVLGCELAQGYLLGRPMPPEVIDDKLAQGTWRFPGLRSGERDSSAAIERPVI